MPVPSLLGCVRGEEDFQLGNSSRLGLWCFGVQRQRGNEDASAKGSSAQRPSTLPRARHRCHTVAAWGMATSNATRLSVRNHITCSPPTRSPDAVEFGCAHIYPCSSRPVGERNDGRRSHMAKSRALVFRPLPFFPRHPRRFGPSSVRIEICDLACSPRLSASRSRGICSSPLRRCAAGAGPPTVRGTGPTANGSHRLFRRTKGRTFAIARYNYIGWNVQGIRYGT